MSAYAHQMERDYSAGSLSSASGEDSERGSRYVMESGFYMTSFAATIFIALLVTVGVLMVSLLILLTVMLQACENRSNGVVETQTRNLNDHYCKSFAMHAELNNLPSLDFPPVCWDLRNNNVGEYERDLEANMWVLEGYFDKVESSEDGRDVVLIDVDSILIPSRHFNHSLSHRSLEHRCDDCSKMLNDSPQLLLVRLYKRLQSSGWLLVLVCKDQEEQRNATVEQLNSAGYSVWSSLVLRSDDEMKLPTNEYLSKRRLALETEGFRVAAIISSQMDALSGPIPGTRVFKLPNLHYYYLEDIRIPNM